MSVGVSFPSELLMSVNGGGGVVSIRQNCQWVSISQFVLH